LGITYFSERGTFLPESRFCLSEASREQSIFLQKNRHVIIFCTFVPLIIAVDTNVQSRSECLPLATLHLAAGVFSDTHNSSRYEDRELCTRASLSFSFSLSLSLSLSRARTSHLQLLRPLGRILRCKVYAAVTACVADLSAGSFANRRRQICT